MEWKACLLMKNKKDENAKKNFDFIFSNEELYNISNQWKTKI